VRRRCDGARTPLLPAHPGAGGGGGWGVCAWGPVHMRARTQTPRPPCAVPARPNRRRAARGQPRGRRAGVRPHVARDLQAGGEEARGGVHGRRGGERGLLHVHGRTGGGQHVHGPVLRVVLPAHGAAVCARMGGVAATHVHGRAGGVGVCWCVCACVRVCVCVHAMQGQALSPRPPRGLPSRRHTACCTNTSHTTLTCTQTRTHARTHARTLARRPLWRPR
jgi:hypothetical protein